jgi:hypothetical protein
LRHARQNLGTAFESHLSAVRKGESMSGIYPVTEFRFASRSGTELATSDQSNWSDIAGLSVPVPDSESSVFLVTLTVPDTWNDHAACGANFRIVSRSMHGTLPNDIDMGQGFYFSATANQRVPFSLVCQVERVPDKNYNCAIVAQWRASQGGTAHIGPLGVSSLAAVGSVGP